ncbi:MAG: ABC transporter ATP-binding protein [Gammaproteobacteria bacterium]|nr:ABC transporter ATP-binding protein [Gammaproteobacteria bacterium]
MGLLVTENLRVDIAGKCVCDALSLSIDAGQIWGVLGSNGVGKSTLLHTLAGLREPGQGSVRLDGHELATWTRADVARRVGVVFQDNPDPFPTTVLQAALIGRHPFLRAWQWESDADRERALAALRAVGIDTLADRMVGTLSGGEKRRLAIATVLTQAPQLFLLDEPINHLDLHHQIELCKLLATYCRERNTGMVMIVHDLNLAARFCDHLMMLFGDGLTRHGTADALLDLDVLQRLYEHPITAIEDGPHRAYIAL